MEVNTQEKHKQEGCLKWNCMLDCADGIATARVAGADKSELANDIEGCRKTCISAEMKAVRKGRSR